MVKAIGVIFSNLHDSNLPELTSKRTMASVPFGCRYRLIDFPLSNMVNCGISNIGIVVHDNYRSLMDHIGTGKDWDLARRSGGINILPPFITAFGNFGAKRLYKTRLEAIVGINEFISRCTEDVVLFSDCDTVCNIDLNRVMAFYEEKNADVVIVTAKSSALCMPIAYESIEVKSDKEGRICDLVLSNASISGAYLSTNILLVNRLYLLALIEEALSHGLNDLYRDLFLPSVSRKRYFSYEYEGTVLRISSLQSYYEASMSLLSDKVRSSLVNVKERPIYTKLRNSSPTQYRSGSSVKNSYIADGCEIEGTVENSIIFRGTKIKKNAVVRNSIILQNTYIGEKSEINSAIIDKDVTVNSARILSGHYSMPFYITKGATV